MLAVSPGRRDRTNRPIACAKNSGVDALVAYTPTASRGTSTPSDTIRTATSQRRVPAENAAMRAEEPGSSESTTVGVSPVIVRQQVGVGAGGGLVGGDDHAAGIGHVLAQAAQPGVGRGDHGGHPLACRVQRGRHARAVCSAVSGSPRRAACSSPALSRQRASPE